MLAEDDVSPLPGELEVAATAIDPGGDSSSTQAAQLSLHALTGDQDGGTIRVEGFIDSHSVRVLVDGGSTHNFIQDSVAKALELTFDSIEIFRVLVGSGQELQCSAICRNVSIMIQNHVFKVDLYALALGGADVVLGAQWLKQLGPVLMDYATLKMSFFYQNQFVELQGNIHTPSMNLHQFQKLTKHEPTAQLFSIQLIDPPSPTHHMTSSKPNDPPESETTQIPPQFQTLIDSYHPLFSEPSTLPPSRPTDHTILLLTNPSPVTVRPYRYPHSQKHEIECQVAKLLENGWIRPSTSPFSSPVLLLKKKDDT